MSGYIIEHNYINHDYYIIIVWSVTSSQQLRTTYTTNHQQLLSSDVHIITIVYDAHAVTEKIEKR